nr:TolC family protein [Sulfurimonas sp. SAG-AH-194-L11]
MFGVILSAQTLTLQHAVEKTLKNHPDVQSFSLKIKQSHSSYKSAFSAYLPQINLQANYNALQTFVFPVNGSFNTIDDSGWSAGASLKQKIWDFSTTTNRVDASKIDEDITKLSLEEFKALLVYKVHSFYELMLVQNEAIQVRQKDLQSKEAYYEQAMALVEQGLKTKADASRFLSAVYIAKENLSTAKASFNKAKNSLSLYMGEKIQDDVSLEEGILQRELSQADTIESEILQNNYQLKILTQNRDKNILLHKATKASHYGSIDAIASYSHIDTLNSYDSKLLGVTLNIPLYSGGRVSAETQKAEIASQITKQQIASQELALKEELENLLIDIQRYKKTIEAKEAQLLSATETKKVLDGRYEEGLSTYIEVLDATSLVLNAELGLLEAYYSKSMSINRLHYLQGRIK